MNENIDKKECNITIIILIMIIIIIIHTKFILFY